MARRSSALVAALLIVLGCADEPVRPRGLVLATTTSVDNSGLLGAINKALEAERGITIRALVVGTGKALSLAAKGEASVTLTHNQEAEEAFVRAHRPAIYRQFMRNEFLLVGPPGDPAGVSSSSSVVDAFARIHRTGALFAARNDDSGTAMREALLWKAAGLDPRQNSAYRPLGQSMAALLRSASELQAYALTDEATFANLEQKLQLKIVHRGDPMLRNTYALIVTRDADPTAREFAAWLVSPHGRRVVENFQIAGKQQFHWIP